MKYPRFCFQESIRHGQAMPCSEELFRSVGENPDVKNICARIAELPEDADEQRALLKKQLPIFCWHACKFEGGRRTNANAVPGGLVMLDVDHISNPYAITDVLATQAAPGAPLNWQKAKENGIYVVAVTPSTKGLRIVGERLPHESLADGQKRIAEVCGITEFDIAPKDLARASFAVESGYYMYVDYEGLYVEAESEEEFLSWASSYWNSGTQELRNSGKETTNEGIFNKTTNLTNQSNLVERLMQKLHLQNPPARGFRNSALYKLARQLRYVADFDVNQLREMLPDWGLPAQEVTTTLHSAINSTRSENMPMELQQVLREMEESGSQDLGNAGNEEDEDSAAPGLMTPAEQMHYPKLPPLLEMLVKSYPEDYRPSVIVSALVFLGALLTKVRFRYRDGATQSLSFLGCVVAPQASGKSFTRTLFNQICWPIMADDAAAREVERQFQERKKAAKNSKQQPEDPRAKIRIITPTASNAIILKRADYAHGEHLLTFAEEIDTLTKGNKAGTWSQKSDLLRMAFDNSLWGQDYMSENSYSGQVNIFYNLLTCGTPRAMKRFFNDVEDGLVSRVIFSQLPDMLGCDMPVFGQLTESEEEWVKHEVQNLYQTANPDHAEGHVWVEIPRLQDAIKEWLDERRMEYLRNQQSPALDVFRRRAAVIGIRAGVLAYMLWGRKETDACLAFARWVASYVLHNQLVLFGEEMNRIMLEGEEVQQKLVPRTKNGTVFDRLPQRFSKQDVITERMKDGQSGPVKMIVSRWCKAGLAFKVGPNEWEKC